MSAGRLILIDQLCSHYKVEESFFYHLQEFGFIEIETLEGSYFIHEDKIDYVEKIIRIRQDLNINLEGIDTILHLLEKINSLQAELTTTRNRLRLYEE